MRKIAVIAATILGLMLPCSVKAQSFYVNYSWQHLPPSPGAQPNCSSEEDCAITFPSQNGLPSAHVTGWAFAAGHVFFSDYNGNHGVATPVAAICTNTDASLVRTDIPCDSSTVYHRWTLGQFSMTVNKKDGSIAGTMSETFTYVVVKMDTRWGPIYVPVEADLQ